METTRNIAHNTRRYRSVHRWLAPLSILLLITTAASGLLLGWKKHSGGWLMADNAPGISTDMSRWLPMDSLNTLADRYLSDSIEPGLSTEKDRIEIRPEKGMVKFTFTEHYHALQLDATTGRLLKTEIRRSDWIERLHDGSLFDRMIGKGSQTGKLAYTTLTATLLLLLTITGTFLWINPIRLRRLKREKKGNN